MVSISSLNCSLLLLVNCLLASLGLGLDMQNEGELISDNVGLDSAVGVDELADDDECETGDCSLNALQLRKNYAGVGTTDAYSMGRRRRHHEYLYPRTRHHKQNVQPDHCNGTELVRGKENCCHGMVIQIHNTACCGTIPYFFTQLSCCIHGDGTATLYDPYSQNCCDDVAKDNKERGICDVPRGQTSCCSILTGSRRRRRRRNEMGRKSRHGLWNTMRNASHAANSISLQQ